LLCLGVVHSHANAKHRRLKNRKSFPFGPSNNRSKYNNLMKSRIRSRWHRPNEKPLENGGTPAALAAPVGEIDPSNSSVLKDDLSNFKPDQSTANEPRKQEHRKGPRNDREKSGNRRRPPRNHHRNKHSEQDNQSDKEGELKGSRNHSKRRPRKRKQNSEHGSDKNQQQAKKSSQSSARKTQKSAPKPSVLKGFLGKLFG
jgi:hypothetical protein